MSRYTIGRSYEYKLKKFLEQSHWRVVRSAGSHGSFDLIAFRDNIPGARCIQIKKTASQRGLNQLFKKFKPEPLDPHTHELWVWYKGQWYTHGLEMVTGTSP